MLDVDVGTSGVGESYIAVDDDFLSAGRGATDAEFVGGRAFVECAWAGELWNLAVGGELVTQSLVVSTNVSVIADALKQFDANGNLLGSAAGSSGALQSVASDSTLKLAGTTDPTKSGLLATSGKI